MSGSTPVLFSWPFPRDLPHDLTMPAAGRKNKTQGRGSAYISLAKSQSHGCFYLQGKLGN